MNVTLERLEVRYNNFADVELNDTNENAQDLINEALEENDYDNNLVWKYNVDGKEWTVDFEEDTKECEIYCDELGLSCECRMYPDTNKPLSEVIKDHTEYIRKVMTGEWKND